MSNGHIAPDGDQPNFGHIHVPTVSEETKAELKTAYADLEASYVALEEGMKNSNKAKEALLNGTDIALKVMGLVEGVVGFYVRQRQAQQPDAPAANPKLVKSFLSGLLDLHHTPKDQRVGAVEDFVTALLQ